MSSTVRSMRIDLHTLDDPKTRSALNCWSEPAHLDFVSLAITLHNAVFDRKEVFADAAAMGLSSAEVRLSARSMIWECRRGDRTDKNFDDLRHRSRRGEPYLWNDCAAPVLHFRRLNQVAVDTRRIDCFDAIELLSDFTSGCSIRIVERKMAVTSASRELIATSDASAACLRQALHEYANAACAHIDLQDTAAAPSAFRACEIL